MLNGPMFNINLFTLISNPVSICFIIAIILYILLKIIRPIHPIHHGIISYENMDGYQFELYVAELLTKFGYKNIHITQKGNDYGVDILCDYKKLKIAIQVKRYNSKVGSRAIQEVVAGKQYYNADKCAVVTNSFFTKQAINMAQKCNVVLIDKSQLDSNNFKIV